MDLLIDNFGKSSLLVEIDMTDTAALVSSSILTCLPLIVRSTLMALELPVFTDIFLIGKTSSSSSVFNLQVVDEDLVSVPWLARPRPQPQVLLALLYTSAMCPVLPQV